MPFSAAVIGGITAAGSIGSSVIQSDSGNSAASAQENAATSVTNQANAAATTAEGAVNNATTTADTGLTAGEDQGNGVISGALSAQQAGLAPYIQAGTTSLSGLQSDLTGLTAPGSQFSFNPATSPQLQFEQQQAQQALMRSAAASGTALSGGTIRASDALNTGLASTYLNQSFNQALAQYNTNRQNTLTQIQGLTNLTGLGYNATSQQNQDIGTAANLTNSNIQNTAARVGANQISAGTYTGNTGLAAANTDEQATIAAANARSANDVAQGKIWGGLTSSLANTAAQLYAGNMPTSGNPQSPDTGPNSSTVQGTNDPSIFSIPDFGSASSDSTGGYV